MKCSFLSGIFLSHWHVSFEHCITSQLTVMTTDKQHTCYWQRLSNCRTHSM